MLPKFLKNLTQVCSGVFFDKVHMKFKKNLR